jgi:hypothetical protein
MSGEEEEEEEAGKVIDEVRSIYYRRLNIGVMTHGRLASTPDAK